MGLNKGSTLSWRDEHLHHVYGERGDSPSYRTQWRTCGRVRRSHKPKCRESEESSQNWIECSEKQVVTLIGLKTHFVSCMSIILEEPLIIMWYLSLNK